MASSIVCLNQDRPLLLYPAEEPLRVEESRQPGAALQVSIPDGQPTPSLEQVALDSVGAVPVLTDRKTPLKPAGCTRPPANHEILRAGRENAP